MGWCFESIGLWVYDQPPPSRASLDRTTPPPPSDVLERAYTVGGGGVPPLTPSTSLPLDPLPPSLLLL